MPPALINIAAVAIMANNSPGISHDELSHGRVSDRPRALRSWTMTTLTQVTVVTVSLPELFCRVT
jgi:hypothetical protein